MVKAGLRRMVRGVFPLMCTLGLGAADSTFFETQNQSPLVSIFGLPFLGEARTLGNGEGSFRVTLDLANHFAGDSAPGEEVELDGESKRFTLSGRYGVGSRGEVGVDIPVIATGGGFLDHFIENFHSTFGFPNHGRDLVPRGRLRYRYQRNGVSVLDMEQSGSGVGDVRLTGGWQVYQSSDARRNWSLRGSLKLPTGDPDRLRGSGSTDLALWVVGSSRSERLVLSGAIGAMGMTRGDVLPDQQRPVVGFGAFAIAYDVAPWLALRAQVNAHSSFYSGSQLREVNGPSAQLTLGGEVRCSRRTSIDLGLSEDLIVNASPDVVFHAALRYGF